MPMWAMAAIILLSVGLWAAVLWPTARDKRATAECDRQVAALLATHDALELERARVLIHELDCSVIRRLP